MPLLDRLVAAVERGHRKILLATAVLVVLSALSLLRLEIDMDLLAQLPESSRTFRDYREVIEGFASRDTLVLRISGEPAVLPEFAAALASRLAELPGVSSVRHRIDVRRIRDEVLRPHRWELLTLEDYSEIERRLSPEAIRERVRGLRRALSMPLAAGAAAEIRTDPLGVDEILGRSLARRAGGALAASGSDGLFRSPSGRSLLVHVRPERSALDTRFGRELLSGVRRVERELLAGPFAGRGIEVGHTGPLVYALADREVLERDLRIDFLLVPVLVLAIFHVGLRTLRILPFVIAPLLVASLVTFALSLLLYGRLTMISIAFAGIFYGLGIDSAIYFYATLRARLAGDDLRGAILGTLREIGPANLLASTTTAGAFFVIGFSEFVGVSQLGVLTGVAMLLNVAGTFVLLPAMIFHQGARAVPRPAGPAPAAGRAYDRLARAVAGRPGRLAAPLLVIVVVAAAGAGRVRLDTDFSNLRPGGGEAERVESAIREDFDRAEAPLTVVVRGGTLEEALSRTHELVDRLAVWRDEGLVESWSAVTAFLPPPDVARSRIERFRALPRERAARDLGEALAAEGFAPDAFAGFFASWLDERPPRLDRRAPALAPVREPHVREVDGRVEVATWVHPAEGVADGMLVDRMRVAPGGDALVVGGQDLVEASFRDLLRRELVGFFAAAVVLNLLLMVVFEGGLARAACLFAPTALGLLATLGWMGLAGLRIDPVNVIVLPVVLGLGVDGTVYLAAHLREAAARGEGAGRGLAPLLLATGTTVAGFGSLALSRFPALAALGQLAAVGLVLCALFSLLLVPVLAGRERRIAATPASRYI